MSKPLHSTVLSLLLAARHSNDGRLAAQIASADPFVAGPGPARPGHSLRGETYRDVVAELIATGRVS